MTAANSVTWRFCISCTACWRRSFRICLAAPTSVAVPVDHPNLSLVIEAPFSTIAPAGERKLHGFNVVLLGEKLLLRQVSQYRTRVEAAVDGQARDSPVPGQASKLFTVRYEKLDGAGAFPKSTTLKPCSFLSPAGAMVGKRCLQLQEKGFDDPQGPRPEVGAARQIREGPAPAAVQEIQSAKLLEFAAGHLKVAVSAAAPSAGRNCVGDDC